MTLSAYVELDTNIHNTPPSPGKSDLRLLQQCFPIPYHKNIIIPYIGDIFQMLLKVMVGAHPPSNTITSLTLWLLIDIVCKLSNITTEVTMTAHKMSHCLSAPIQPTHFKSTPSSLVFENNSEN
jgi:hypothetical protein